MYARVSQYEGGAPEGLEESVRRGREEILPAARELDGFAGAIALLDRRSGRHMVISLWESEEAMAASEDVAEELRRRQLTGGEQVASVGRYEVAMLELESAAQAQERPGRAGGAPPPHPKPLRVGCGCPPRRGPALDPSAPRPARARRPVR